MFHYFILFYFLEGQTKKRDGKQICAMEASDVESRLLESALSRELVLGEPFLLLHILSFLPAADLGRATLVCRHFYAVGAQDGDYLWRNLLAQDRKLEDWRDVRRKETARAYVTNDRLFVRAWQSGDLQVVTLSGHKVRLLFAPCVANAHLLQNQVLLNRMCAPDLQA